MNQNIRLVLLFVAAAVGAVAVAVGVNYATGSSPDAWNSTASLVSLILAASGVLTSVGAAFYAQRAERAAESASDVKEQLAFRLIRTLAEMEQEALNQEELDPKLSRRHISLRDVKLAMTAARIWDSQDQIGFDLATRARNSVVHGDLEGLDLVDLRYANEKAEQLLKKMRAVSGS